MISFLEGIKMVRIKKDPFFSSRLMRQFSIHIKNAVKSLLYDSDKYYNWIGKVQTFVRVTEQLTQAIFQLIHKRTFALKTQISSTAK